MNNPKNYVVNDKISAKEVLLITESGEKQHMTLTEALNLAKNKSLDLVEVFVQNGTTVCKILDFKKFLFKKNKQKTVKHSKLKTYNIGIFTDTGDYNVKIRAINQHLQKGHQIKLGITSRGRQKLHVNTKLPELITKITNDISNNGTVASESPSLGGIIVYNIFINPKSKKK